MDMTFLRWAKNDMPLKKKKNYLLSTQQHTAVENLSFAPDLLSTCVNEVTKSHIKPVKEIKKGIIIMHIIYFIIIF